ncbi:hypothetical protein [Argonema antarcticum]|uniref:hypothetical protein n=1 Tax=Argonema antarcticum TaxID=2942763 RepID=UPI002013528C|nr:hypothetical protein [Argonema antarcticum]MCL1471103.1 hypothetical protein [Argonema antarcticum A004/B2]
MGYTTEFDGTFHLNKRLFDSEFLYLLEFSQTRRMKRDVTVLESFPDPARTAVNLPLGEDGCYFVNEKWDKNSEISIVDYNRPPAGQPGLWCHWIPNSDGSGIQWDGGEKFYHYIEWLQYLIDRFLQPWGYLLNGKVHWQGEDSHDYGHIHVENNKIVCPSGAEELLSYAVSPVQIPLAVFQSLEAVQLAGISLANWHGVMEQATALGYPETVKWMESNIEKYFDGLQRGFEANNRVLKSMDFVL